VDQSFPGLLEGSQEIILGREVSGWIDVRNDGMETWSPGSTFLAPLPRDHASAVAASDWISGGRAATVDATTSPGSTGRFSFSLAGNELGAMVQYFGLVQEGITWFADAPYGGGPPDDFMAVSVDVVGEPTDDTSPPDDSEPPPRDSAALDDGWVQPGPRQRSPEPQGCGCSGRPQNTAAWGLLALMGLGIRRARPGEVRPRLLGGWRRRSDELGSGRGPHR
jgi:hypothetical protein